MKTRSMSTALVTLLILLVFHARAWATDYDGMLSLSPVQEHSCVAVTIPVTPGQALSGIRWLHNDETIAFPKLLILEAKAGAPPDLTETSLVLDEITGESLAWGEVAFEVPITSSTPYIHAVFQLPAFTERTGEGIGGGPGIGYVQERHSGAAYLSSDGVNWTRLHPMFSLRVETVVVLGKVPDTVALADAKQNRPAGWWDDLAQPGSSMRPENCEDRPPMVSSANPLVVMPNPFNPRTTVAFHVETAGRVALDVFDLRGRRVRTLTRAHHRQGAHSIVWTGVDDRGTNVASGVYFLRLQTPDGTHMKRAALVR